MELSWRISLDWCTCAASLLLETFFGALVEKLTSMDPFRFHEWKDTLDLPNPNLSSTLSKIDPSKAVIAVPAMLLSKVGEVHECESTTSHHVIKTRTECTSPGFHVVTSIVQSKASSPRAILGPGSYSSSMASSPGSLSESSLSSPTQENWPWAHQQVSHRSRSMSECSMKEGFRAFCSLCKKNGETAQVYTSHQLHTLVNGQRIVSCPILRTVRCKNCNATGDFAHTLSHCPLSPGQVPVALIIKKTRRQGNGALRRS